LIFEACMKGSPPLIVKPVISKLDVMAFDMSTMGIKCLVMNGIPSGVLHPLQLNGHPCTQMTNLFPGPKYLVPRSQTSKTFKQFVNEFHLSSKTFSLCLQLPFRQI
jgi:hypothetical protein